MASVRLLRRAEADLGDAIAWYEARSSQAARRFESAMLAALARIGSMPELYAETDGGLRLCPVRKYPYVIQYRFDLHADEVVVAAVSDARQDPLRWQAGS